MFILLGAEPYQTPRAKMAPCQESVVGVLQLPGRWWNTIQICCHEFCCMLKTQTGCNTSRKLSQQQSFYMLMTLNRIMAKVERGSTMFCCDLPEISENTTNINFDWISQAFLGAFNCITRSLSMGEGLPSCYWKGAVGMPAQMLCWFHPSHF